MIEKTVSEIRINGKVVNNLNSLYWGETDTKYIVEVPKTLEEYTWSEINEIACNGLAPVKFKIGDTKTVTLTTGEKITVRIIGFDHDKWLRKTAKITFEMVGLLAATEQMGGSSSNYGFGGSALKNQLTYGAIYQTIPQEIKDVVYVVYKSYMADKYKTSYSTVAANFFVLSESEIFGSNNVAYMSTGEQYEYYKKNNNAQARIKKINGVATRYWLRDAAYTTNVTGISQPTTIVDENGKVSYTYNTGDSGVAIAFCVGKEPDAPKTPLDAPVITISVSTISWVAISNATNYAIYLNGSHFMYTNQTSIDLSQNITTAGTYTVQVKARGSGSYSDSELSNSVTYTKPNTAITVIFRRADTAEFAQGFTIDIQCGTQSLWFGEYDYDEAKSITIPSSGTAIKVTFNGVSGTSYTNARYVAGSITGTKTVSTSKTVTIYASSNNEVIDISYFGTN